MGKNKSGLALLTGLLVGGLTGAAAGILFAPKEGAKTRQELMDKANNIQKKGATAFNKLRRERLEPLLNDVREQVEEKGAELRKSFTERVKDIQKEVKHEIKAREEK